MDSISFEHNPAFGFTQPEGGVTSCVTYRRMGRPKTPSKPANTPGQMIFRARLEELLQLVFPKAENETARIKALAKRAGLGPETIRTALKGERNPTLTVIEQIASGLGVSLQQLFSPAPIDFLPPSAARGKTEGPRPQ